MSKPAPVFAKTPLGRLYQQHLLAAGFCGMDLPLKTKAMHRHFDIGVGLVGAARLLLDGDGFTAFCKDAGLDEDLATKQCSAALENLPPLP